MAIGNKHILREIIPNETWGHIAVCGETAPSDMFMTRTPDIVVNLCPKCSSKHYAQKLKETPNGYKLGERLNLSEDRRRYAFKSIYPVLNDANEQVAFIAIFTGWGKPWGVFGFESALLMSQIRAGAEPPPAEMNFKEPAKYNVTFGTKDGPKKTEMSSLRFSSKEQALTAIPSMIEDGFLRTPAQIRAKDEQIITDSLRRLAAREAEEREIAAAEAEAKRIRDEQIARIEESFTKLCKPDSGLNNFDRTALADAASLLGVKIPDLV